MLFIVRALVFRSFIARIGFITALVGALAGCTALPQRPPAPTLDEIRQMAKEKVPADRIIERIRDSGAVYRLNGSDYAKLRDDGIPNEVLDFMFQQQVEAARYDEWLAARDRYFWGPWGYRPFPAYPYASPYWGPIYPFRP